ncbi:MAG TPA: hypothetical protein VN372_14105 [Methanospirillum sp.]|nr:hypothetical protein [Methanospirillum sp.]
MLNRWTECSTGCFYHPATVYEQNVDAWNGTRIVLNPNEYWAEHPDSKLFAADPDSALTAVGAVDIGHIDDVRIVWEGHPRLMAAMHIDQNNAYGKIALDLYYAGMFGISIADIFEASEGVVTGNIEPNHVLVFKEDGWNMPADKGAVAANSKRVSCFSNQHRRPDGLTTYKPIAANSANDLKPLFSDFFEKIKGLFSPGSSEVQSAANSEQKNLKTMAEDTKPEPQVAALNQQIGALEKDRADLNTKLETVTAELTGLKATSEKQASELATLKTEKAEAALKAENDKKDKMFAAFLETVPHGEKVTQENVATLRTMFFEDPLATVKKAQEWATAANSAPGRAGTKQVSANLGAEPKTADWAGLFHKGGN